MPSQQRHRKLSHAVENYLKAILQIGNRSGNEWVSTGALAEELSLSPGTVTSMLKTLDESKTEILVEYKPYEGVRLTDEGNRTALIMLRRHRLIELFLTQTLGLSWDKIHEEAENMEHAVSDELIDRIDEYLGHPDSDPHGDPIPSPEGKLRGENLEMVSLGSLPLGSRFRLTRVTNQSPEFLRYLTKSGIELGVEGEILETNPDAGILSLKHEQQTVVLGFVNAESLLVQRLD
ncbi:Iron-dependent repressor IdeR [Polystyrenella longa]|uniref:Transcriptional regulator MntR n=1 Tax=Polystyrenella longa TaxID=2528007 RepID=A0A518CU26_9PLAN|nr:metal-dependent transcriptional regulator [Polystyrenella longa]QDU82733.1 Iron-dependent repressor IdeR [Polystyrenella longa]